MISIKLGDKQYSIPSEPHEISLEQGISINYIKTTQGMTLDSKREILDIVYPPMRWDIVQEKSIDNIINNLNYIDIEQIRLSYINNTFKYKGQYFGLHKLQDVTVREYMEIDYHLNNGECPLDNLDKICTILWRPITEKTIGTFNILKNKVIDIYYKGVKPFLTKDYSIGKWNTKLEDNTSLMRENLTFKDGLYALVQWSEYKNSLANEFTPIFGSKSDEYDPFEEEQKELDKNTEHIKTFEELWGFYHVFVSTVDSLIERDLWLERDIKEFMTLLSYLYMKSKEEEKNNTNQDG